VAHAFSAWFHRCGLADLQAGPKVSQRIPQAQAGRTALGHFLRQKERRLTFSGVDALQESSRGTVHARSTAFLMALKSRLVAGFSGTGLVYFW
jgi:hypothetical protein